MKLAAGRVVVATAAVGGLTAGLSFKWVTHEVIRHTGRGTLYNDRPSRFSTNKGLYWNGCNNDSNTL